MASQGQSLYKMSDETFDFICTTCDDNGKIVEAVKFCVECQGYCCQACTDMHYKSFPVLKTHTLLDAVQGNQASNKPRCLPEFPTERCSIHQGKILDLYCQDHDDIVCCTCVATDHKDCPKKSIFSIPDTLDKLFKIGECKQIQGRLRDIIVSMTTLGKSKDDKLEALKDAKEESTKEVENFQKTLEAIIRKAAKASKQEIETIYKELVKEVLKDKESIESIASNLHKSDKKLENAGGNRAQKYVCTKLAEKKIKGILAFDEKIRNSDDKLLTFTPSQPLMNIVNSLQNIGTVDVTSKKTQYLQRKSESRSTSSQTFGRGVKVGSPKRQDLYKIIKSKNINTRVTEDHSVCDIRSCCLTFDNTLLVTDYNNKKLKRVDVQSMNIIDNCTLDCNPCGVCCLNQDEAVVACGHFKKIQFVSIDNKMKPTRHIKMSHYCCGIATFNNKLYTSDGGSFYVYDITGNLLKTTSYGNPVIIYSVNIAVSADGRKLYVSDWNKGVICFDNEGNYLSTYTDRDMSDVRGVCVDGSSNLFVARRGSHNVVQLNEDGKKIGVVVKQQDGLHKPLSVCFHQQLNRLFVTMEGSDMMKMYELY